MEKSYEIKVEAEGIEPYELAEALRHVARQIDEGFTSGDLRNDSIESGSWDITEHDVCEFCGGKDGEHEDITTMEQVYPGEPHVAPIGTQKCPNA